MSLRSNHGHHPLLNPTSELQCLPTLLPLFHLLPSLICPLGKLFPSNIRILREPSAAVLLVASQQVIGVRVDVLPQAFARLLF